MSVKKIKIRRKRWLNRYKIFQLMNLDDKLNNKEAVKKKQNKTKKERERNKRKSFTIGYERNTQKTSAHSSSIHSQHIYWLRI